MQAARAADPPDIALELRQRQDAKKVKQRKQADREEAKRVAHAQAVASGQDGKTKVEFKTWGSGGIVAQKSEEVKVEDDAEEGVVLDDDDVDADLPDEPLQASLQTCQQASNQHLIAAGLQSWRRFLLLLAVHVAWKCCLLSGLLLFAPPWLLVHDQHYQS